MAGNLTFESGRLVTLMGASDAVDSSSDSKMLLMQLQDASKMAPSSSIMLMLSSSCLVSQNLASSEEKYHESIARFIACYIQAVAQCASKCRSDKIFDLEMTHGLSGCLVVALNPITLDYAKRIVPPVKFQTLVVYLIEVAWSYLLRSVEICACEDVIGLLRGALIQIHRYYLAISCIKGFEMVSNREYKLCFVDIKRSTTCSEQSPLHRICFIYPQHSS